MSHYSAIRVVVIDVPSTDHDHELAFWQAAIGKQLTRDVDYPEYHGALLPHHEHLGLIVQRLQQGQARVHLDLHTDDVAAEVARLEELGARREQAPQDWYAIMRDPAGLPFCVIPAKPGSLKDDNAQHWDTA